MRRNEPVSHIMTKNPATVHLKETLQDARDRMTELGCHHIPVVSGKKLVGMLSTTDLLRFSYTYDDADGHKRTEIDHTRTIEEAMTSELVSVTAKQPVRTVAGLFAENTFHSLPVVEDDELVGIVTTTDLIKYMVDQY